MKIEVREILRGNDVLSRLFYSCLTIDQMQMIRNENWKDKDWKTESCTIPVEMKIAGVDINPKAFFDNWNSQMNRLIADKASQLVKENYEEKIHISKTLSEMQNKISDYQQIVDSWESEINWTVPNPMIDNNKKL